MEILFILFCKLSANTFFKLVIKLRHVQLEFCDDSILEINMENIDKSVYLAIAAKVKFKKCLKWSKLMARTNLL